MILNDENREPESESEMISLHEMQMLVREATQRCKELGLNYVRLEKKKRDF